MEVKQHNNRSKNISKGNLKKKLEINENGKKMLKYRFNKISSKG